jgi:hypothetical protein
MSMPIEKWKERLKNGTPVFTYINCSVQDGQYFGLEEYRAAAANAFGSGADGIYLFNYPCLFELAMMKSAPRDTVTFVLPDMRDRGQPDLSVVGQALDEIGSPQILGDKDKHFEFYFSKDARYRHYSPTLAGVDRNGQPALKATFRCYEDGTRARTMTLKFKIENVVRSETFEIYLNDKQVDLSGQQVWYAANGRDTRVHTVQLGPYLEYEISLHSNQLRAGENTLEVRSSRLVPGIPGQIHLTEIELFVRYSKA